MNLSCHNSERKKMVLDTSKYLDKSMEKSKSESKS